MNKDILTLSRIVRLLTKAGLMDGIQLDSPESLAMLAGRLADNNIVADLLKIIYDVMPDGSADGLVIGYFIYVAGEMQDYAVEIDRRRSHATSLGVYREDSEEEMLAKIEKNKDLYITDQYFACWTLLDKMGVSPAPLTISESLLAMEDILCEETNKATAQMLSMIEADNKTFACDTRDILRHANFNSFALDIFNMVDSMYQSIESKKNNK